MRVALFSDIHGNVVGLKAILAHLAQQGGADCCYVLGDVLAPGPGAEDVMELLDQLPARILRGNWDELFVDPDAYIAALPVVLHESSWQYYRWLREHLSPESQHWLANLPMSAEVTITPGTTLYLCHAAPNATTSTTCTVDTDPSLLRATYGHLDATIVAYGHYHAHHVLQLDGKLLINVASVGMTKSKPSAYTLLTIRDDHVAIQQFQVPYDREEYARLLHTRHVPSTTVSHE
jgi:predicted phosphodiesterase